MKEVGNMRNCNHPHIVKIIDVEENGKYRFDIIQEYCDQGNLEDYIEKLDERDERLTEAQVANIIFQIGSAILHMHIEGMIHRDIKDANILITSGGIYKLADLGQSRTLA